jgi:two-component system OmpR family sensor kinase
MSIRLRLTLLYSLILTLTLVVFGVALYTIQAQYTLNSIKGDLVLTGNNLAQAVLRMSLNPNPPPNSAQRPPPPLPLDTLSSDPSFQELREREIVRVLDPQGNLAASPLSGEQEALPLSAAGLQAVQNQQVWWETGSMDGESVLIYNRPVVAGGEVVSIVQVARQLTERNRSLALLSRTLIFATLLATLAAFGIGWVLAGYSLRPIHRITQTAQAIGRESDFSRRVDYRGPNDEIGQLATTFNSMLARLQDAYLRVSQALEMQRNFVGDVSHELRTPLTTVRGNLALLRHDPPLPVEEQADILSDLSEESERLIHLVNDLLILARADAGRSLVREPVAVQPVVAEACRQARQLAPQREISEDAQPLSVLGDRGALKQVLLILLDNALKYTQGPIQVSAAELGGEVVLGVADHGPGMAPETLEHLFDRFYRGEADPDVPGFGLGLSIARALIEEQGGMIHIESQPGQGSLVRLHLPLAEGQ